MTPRGRLLALPDRRNGNGGDLAERTRQLTVPGVTLFVRQSKPLRGRPGGCAERCIGRLHQIDEAPVVAKVFRQQLRMAVQPQPLDDEPLEVPDEEIGQVKGARLGIAELGKGRGSGEEFVAVRTGQARDAFGGEHRVEHAAGTAIRIRNEDAFVAPARRANRRLHCTWDPLRAVVQFRWQAFDRHVRPAVQALEGHDLPGQGSAGDDQERFGTLGHPRQCAAARRAAISVFAVSTAMAASRQYASAPIALAKSSFSGAPPTMTMYLSRKPFCLSVSMTTFI